MPLLTTGKDWKAPKAAFRPTAGLSTYQKRAEQRKQLEVIKAKEKEMKADKQAEREVRRASDLGVPQDGCGRRRAPGLPR